MIVLGLINMPTDTKNMAPNRFLREEIKCSILSAFVVSARMDPIMNAPNAGENPAYRAIITNAKHKAREKIKRISSLSKFFKNFKMDGKKKMPETNQRTRKKNNFETENSNSVPSNSRLIDRVVNITIKITAARSSTIRTLVTILVNFCVLTFSS